jgi:hypothetical protein
MTSWSVVAMLAVGTAIFILVAVRSSGRRRQEWSAGAGAWFGITGLALLGALRVDSLVLQGLAILIVVVCVAIGFYFRWYPVQ